MSTKKQVLFIHSAGSQGPQEGSSYLAAHLRHALGATYDFRHPIMPDPEDPDYGAWKTRIAEEFTQLTGSVVFVGHSLGASVLLKFLSEEQWDCRVAGLCLVATPWWGAEGWEYEAFVLNESFASELARIPRIILYHSRDDDVVPFAHLDYYAREFPQATIHALNGRGHAFENGEFPELVEEIKSLFSRPAPV